MRFMNSTMLTRVLVAFATGPSAVGMSAATSESCETVTIKTPNGPVRMNKSDYDASPDDYTLHEKETKTHTAEGTAKSPEPGPGGHVALTAEETAMREKVAKLNPGVVQEGVRFFVISQEADGSMIGRLNCNDKGKALPEGKWEFPNIDPKGYDTTQEAWDAAIRLKGLVTEPNPPVSAPPVNNDE